MRTEGVRDVFAFSGDGGLNNNTGGSDAPRDTIGQVQFDLAEWEDRPVVDRPIPLFGGLLELPRTIVDPPMTATRSSRKCRSGSTASRASGPRSSASRAGHPPASRSTCACAGDNWEELQEATRIVRERFENTPGLTLIEDTLPLPGVDWELSVDVEAAGRFGANVATVGGMVQLVTRGLLLDTMRVPSSDEEIEIRVRFPEEARVLSTLDSLRLRTADGLVPLSNFVSREPAPQLAEIDRRDQSRIFNVRADVVEGLVRVTDTETGETRSRRRPLSRPTPTCRRRSTRAA